MSFSKSLSSMNAISFFLMIHSVFAEMDLKFLISALHPLLWIGYMMLSFSFLGSLPVARKLWKSIRNDPANSCLHDFKGIAGKPSGPDAEFELISSSYSTVMAAVFFCKVVQSKKSDGLFFICM